MGDDRDDHCPLSTKWDSRDRGTPGSFTRQGRGRLWEFLQNLNRGTRERKRSVQNQRPLTPTLSTTSNGGELFPMNRHLNPPEKDRNLKKGDMTFILAQRKVFVLDTLLTEDQYPPLGVTSPDLVARVPFVPARSGVSYTHRLSLLLS